MSFSAAANCRDCTARAIGSPKHYLRAPRGAAVTASLEDPGPLVKARGASDVNAARQLLNSDLLLPRRTFSVHSRSQEHHVTMGPDCTLSHQVLTKSQLQFRPRPTRLMPVSHEAHGATTGDRRVTQSIAITTRPFPGGATDGLVQPKRAAPLWVLTVFTHLASSSTSHVRPGAARARVSWCCGPSPT